MRISGVWTLLISLCLWAWGSAQAQTSEYIARADITVHIDKAGDLKIREELDYVKPRGEPKRGIFRELPTKVREGNVTHRKAYTLILATRNGQTETVTRQTNNGTMLWRLGRADVFLKEGVQRYVLEYGSEDWLIRYDDLDELRWNIWGEYWDMPVQTLTGRIILPEGASAKQVAAYSGAYGQTGNDVTVKAAGNIIEFSANKPLSPREAVTLAVGVEKGVFNAPSSAQLWAKWWRANGAVFGLSLLTLVVSGFYFLNWSKVGRDPVKPPVFARYEAPKGYSAAAAKWILEKGMIRDEALISTLLSLAIKSRLKIDVTKKETILTKMPPHNYSEALLNPEESLLFAALFNSSKSEIILRKNKPNRRFHQATLTFRRHLHSLYSEPYHKRNGGYILAGVVLTFAGFMAVFGLFLTPGSLFFWGLVAGLIAINLLFLFLMPAPTKKGAKLRSEIEGFKLYLETAEKLRLNSAEIGTDRVPAMTEARYEAFLPYAVALDVEEPWTEHFEKTLPVAAENYRPSYYNSYRGGGFGRGGIGSMNRDMVKALSSGVASARPVQTSSSGSSSGRSFSGCLLYTSPSPRD